MLTNDNFLDDKINICVKSNKIQENLNSKISLINDVIDKFSKFYEKDDDEEYENIFNRINIYFTSIINEIKLSYYENTKDILQREKFNLFRIKELESQLFFINEKYREEKEIMENKIEELEKNLKQSQEVLIEKDQKFKNLMRIHDADIVHLITQGLISKIEFNEMQIVLNESIEDRKMTRERIFSMNNKSAHENVSPNDQSSENKCFIDKEAIIKANNQQNTLTKQSNKILDACYENDSQSCIYAEINKKNFFESKKSFDDIPKNIFSNIKSRNKLPNKNYEIKSLNDLEVTPPIYETYQEPVGDFSVFKTYKDAYSLKTNTICKTPNLDMNINKKISPQTVYIDSTHKKMDKNSKSLNSKINSSANLVNNSELISKLDKMNFNLYNIHLGSNVIKSHKNFNEINGYFNNKSGLMKDKTETHLNFNQGHNKINQKSYKFPSSYNNYRMIKPEKKNLINCNKSSKTINSELNKNNQNHKKSFDLDKPFTNLHVSQNQFMDNNSNNKFMGQRIDNNNLSQNKILFNNQSNKSNQFKNQSSKIGYKYTNELDVKNNSYISKSPLLRIQEISDSNNNEKELYNFNLSELNNKSSKFSRNDKKNILSNLYLNTVNNSNNLGKINLTTQYNTNKNEITSYKSYIMKDNNVVFMDTYDQPNNKNNKSIDFFKNFHIGIDQQSLTCTNKEQKVIKFSSNNMEFEQKDKFVSNLYNKDLKKQINDNKVLNDKYNSNIYKEIIVHSDSNNLNSKASYKCDKAQNINKTSSLNPMLNDNCKSKKTLININKRFDNSMVNLNLKNLVTQTKDQSLHLSETPSNKKLSKDSKFKL